MKHTSIRSRDLFVAFGGDDTRLTALILRVCVLFEDLRLELLGSSADEIEGKHLDAAGVGVRKVYFLRKLIGTLSEFAEAFRLLDECRQFATVKEAFSTTEAGRWSDCVEFFALHEPELKLIRNDVGGHFGSAAAAYAVEHLVNAGRGFLEINRETEGPSAGMRLKFVEQIANAACFRHMQDETQNQFAERFGNLTGDGFKHAARAANVLGSRYICPKFELTPW